MINEEAIRHLQAARLMLLGKDNQPISDLYYAIDAGIEALEQTQWIPVSERLPEANEYIVDVARYYLVQNEYGDILVARYRGEYWEQIYQLKPIDDEIVAWMPLPKPYEPQKRSE